jgi:hypothetical protein
MAESISTRCFPKSLADSFQPGEKSLALREIHAQIASNTPFFHFVNIPAIGAERVRLTHLCRHWVSGTIFSFGGVNLEFTPEDVAILIGLPKRGLELTTGQLQNVGACSILNRYFKGRSPTVVEIKSKMLEVRGQDELAEDYVRLWVMYIFAALLFTDGCQRAPRDVSVLVDNLEELNKYDWPSAIHRYTTEGISRYRNARGDTTYLKGCPVLLTVGGSTPLVFFSSVYYLRVLRRSRLRPGVLS